MELNDALDQLVTFGAVQARPVPGGHGLARDGVVFAVFNDGRLYFHTDDESRTAYAERGMEAFSLRPGAGPSRYYEVPANVFSDPDTLVEWAAQALDSRPSDNGRNGRTRRASQRRA